jgi:hypothetical protein
MTTPCSNRIQVRMLILFLFLLASFSLQRCVDGWLGFMVGQELWHPMYDESAVEKTAVAIKGLVGDGAPRIADRSSVAKQQQKVIASPSPAPTSPATVPATASWETKVWTLLTDPEAAVDAAALKTHLNGLNVKEAGDLQDFDDGDIAELATFLKKHPQKKLLRIFKDSAVKA